MKTVGIPLAVAAMTGGLSAVPAAAAAVGTAIVINIGGKEKDGEGEDILEVNWSELIEANPEKPDVMSVRKFREEFEKMLAKTGISALIVKIERCRKDTNVLSPNPSERFRCTRSCQHHWNNRHFRLAKLRRWVP